MKTIFTAVIIFFAIQARASDTLTRAQVYSFSVGDTFDYEHYVNYWDHQYIDTTYISYSRKVITNIYYSLDSNTKFIEQTTIYPLPVAKDTLALPNLQDCELCLDTSNYFQPCTLTFISNSVYERTLNIIVVYKGGPPYPYQRFFVQGLGEVMDIDNGSYLGGEVGQIDTLQLIYYASGSTKWGSPYYTFPTGVGNISNTETIIYPVPNDGRFRLATAIDKPPVVFWVYDILGNIVFRETITATNTAIDMQKYGSGLYLWKITEENKIVRSGKIVIQ